jgi:hypothetical protein
MSSNTTVRCIENNASNIFFISFKQFYVNQYQNIPGAKDTLSVMKCEAWAKLQCNLAGEWQSLKKGKKKRERIPHMRNRTPNLEC